MLRGYTHRSAVLMAFAAIYLIWGSTFLFTKLAVNHLPIALYAAVRFLTAGSLLALMARIFRREEWPRRLIDWRHVLVTGFFMVFVSNGLNAWAMQFIATNESALLNGTSAFWIAGNGKCERGAGPVIRFTPQTTTMAFDD